MLILGTLQQLAQIKTFRVNLITVVALLQYQLSIILEACKPSGGD